MDRDTHPLGVPTSSFFCWVRDDGISPKEMLMIAHVKSTRSENKRHSNRAIKQKGASASRLSGPRHTAQISVSSLWQCDTYATLSPPVTNTQGVFPMKSMIVKRSI